MKKGSRFTGSLSPAKRELASLLLKKQGVDFRDAGTIPRKADPRACPLSYAQERIWFFEQLEPGTAAYNVPLAVRLTGSVNVPALEHTLREIARRHESLRTSFIVIDGKAVQVVKPEIFAPLPIIDLRSLRNTDLEAHARELAREESRRPFDLSQGPIFRAALLGLGEDDFVLLVTLHHIASDGWSMSVLVREVSALYRAFSQGLASPLAELPIQYSDFAEWQKGWLRDNVLDAQLSYWKQQLDGAPSHLNLSTDRPRSQSQTLNAGYISHKLPQLLSERLKALSRQEGVTLFMVALAAFDTLLYRYTWQEDLVVGTPIANRNRRETESLIGFFVNTLVLRTSLSDNPTFVELLARVKAVTLRAYANQDLPFEVLVSALQPERALSRIPLFQVFFALNNNPALKLDLDGVRIERLVSTNGVAKFEIEMSLLDQGADLLANVIYKSELFDEATITQMLDNYEALLEYVAENPYARLLDIPLPGDNQTGYGEASPSFQNSDEFVFEI